jgi:hypothetical protein
VTVTTPVSGQGSGLPLVPTEHEHPASQSDKTMMACLIPDL